MLIGPVVQPTSPPTMIPVLDTAPVTKLVLTLPSFEPTKPPTVLPPATFTSVSPTRRTVPLDVPNKPTRLVLSRAIVRFLISCPLPSNVAVNFAVLVPIGSQPDAPLHGTPSVNTVPLRSVAKSRSASSS